MQLNIRTADCESTHRHIASVTEVLTQMST